MVTGFFSYALAAQEVVSSETLQNPSSKETSAGPKPGEVWRDQATGMEFVFVKGGCFQMGDTFGDGDKDEKPAREVCVGDFWMGVHEVTQGQWERMMGSNPSYLKSGDRYPVEQVDWGDVQGFIQRLNARSGKKYRLPTEAEWEYAARSGGKSEKWPGTSSENDLGRYAWFVRNSESKTHPVGKKSPNSLGLYDMSGNVWEWCHDWYDPAYYKGSPRNNPGGPEKGQSKVIRGGSYVNAPRDARASTRYWFGPRNHYLYVGFRLVFSAE